MTDTKPIRRIAIIGTGVIGASWTALFLAKGLQVVATDIAPDAEVALRKFVRRPGRRSNDWAFRPAHRSRTSSSRPTSRRRLTAPISSRRTGPSGSNSSRSSMGSSTSCCRPT